MEDWKAVAESIARLEARGFEVRRARPFRQLEKKIPKLIAEMREDIRKHELTKEVIVLRNRRIGYNPGTTLFFTYFVEDHTELMSAVKIMIHYRAIYDAAFNQVPRYNFNEDFVEYLLATAPAACGDGSADFDSTAQ